MKWHATGVVLLSPFLTLAADTPSSARQAQGRATKAATTAPQAQPTQKTGRYLWRTVTEPSRNIGGGKPTVYRLLQAELKTAEACQAALEKRSAANPKDAKTYSCEPTANP